MGYIETLDPVQKHNLELITAELIKNFDSDLTNAGILTVVNKEGGFYLKPELSYAGTSNAQIRKIFGSRVADLIESQLTVLKKNDRDFFEKVYGVKSGVPLGNTEPGDGYKFRGRGFHGLTGRSNHEFYGKLIGYDLVNNPDLLSNPAIAAKELVAFFKHQLTKPGNKIKDYGAGGVNGFKTLRDSTTAVYHANAGWGKTHQQIEGDTTGGLAKARKYAPEFLAYLEGQKKKF